MVFLMPLDGSIMVSKQSQNSQLFFDNWYVDVLLFYPKRSNWMFLPLKPFYGFTDRRFYRSPIALTNRSIDQSLSAQLIGSFRKSTQRLPNDKLI